MSVKIFSLSSRDVISWSRISSYNWSQLSSGLDVSLFGRDWSLQIYWRSSGPSGVGGFINTGFTLSINIYVYIPWNLTLLSIFEIFFIRTCVHDSWDCQCTNCTLFESFTLLVTCSFMPTYMEKTKHPQQTHHLVITPPKFPTHFFPTHHSPLPTCKPKKRGVTSSNLHQKPEVPAWLKKVVNFSDSDSILWDSPEAWTTWTHRWVLAWCMKPPQRQTQMPMMEEIYMRRRQNIL